MRTRLQFLFDDQLPVGGFALFRVAYSLVLLGEVTDLLRFRHLLFDPIPYLTPCEVSFGPLLSVWLLVIASLTVGFHTRAMSIANYCFTLITFSAFTTYEYHVDYIYTATNLLLIFLPLSNRLSVDAWLQRKRTGSAPPNEVSRIYRDAVLFCCVGLIYFDSVLFKLGSPMWWKGLGVWLPASYPHATWMKCQSWLLDNHLLMMLLGYGTILFEGLFLFVMWSRRYHMALLISGVLLHSGIVMIFPIPWFGLAVMAIYLLLLPETLIRRLFPVLALPDDPAQKEDCRHYYVAAIAVAALFLQMPSIINSPAVRLTAHFTNATTPWRAVADPLRPYMSVAQPILGTTPHPVFMDMHFAGYDHELAVVHRSQNGSEEWLPLISESGNAQQYNFGRLWVNWSFRICGPQLNTHLVRRGITRITAFWSFQHDVSLRNCEFRILAREYDQPQDWEKGFARRQSNKPWKLVGRLNWTKQVPSFEFDNPDESRHLAQSRSLNQWQMSSSVKQ